MYSRWIWQFFLIFSSLMISGSVKADLNMGTDTGAEMVYRRSVALVYKGEGACDEGCSDAAAAVAMAAGFRPRFVSPDELDSHSTPQAIATVFENAKVWIQPGGVAVTAFFAMTPVLRQAIRDFVGSGGGYVGFCAGAFMATSRIGSTRYAGLGLLPGFTAPYYASPISSALGYSLEMISWGRSKRNVFFEGGPYFYGFEDPTQGPVGEGMATYDTGYTAAVRASFGKGRVFVSGPHPEAPLIWTEEDGVLDPDGVDTDLAIQMVLWASGAIKSK